MPYKDLGLDRNSTVIGHSAHCVVYQAYYCGMAVTVKRLVPPGNPKTHTLFKRHSFRVSPAISPATSLDIAAGRGLRQTQSLDVVRPAALTPALLRASSIGPISPVVVGRESSKPLLPAADWIASDSQQAEYRIGAGWQLRAQQLWVLAKAKLAQTWWQFWDVASGQYFVTLLVKHRVRALERELCMTLCLMGIKQWQRTSTLHDTHCLVGIKQWQKTWTYLAGAKCVSLKNCMHAERATRMLLIQQHLACTGLLAGLAQDCSMREGLSPKHCCNHWRFGISCNQRSAAGMHL